jgi:DNA topoisomerase IA
MLKFRKKSKIEFFDSIEEVPHRRYMKFNKELMRSNEVGSSPIDILKRIQRCIDYIMAGNKESALKELANAQLAYNYAMLELDPKGLALAAMIMLRK